MLGVLAYATGLLGRVDDWSPSLDLGGIVSNFVVKEALPLTDGTTVDLRPQWNVDGKSIVFERRTANGSMLLRAELSGLRLTKVEPLDLCNKGATRTQGRAAFFGQDDFAFVSNQSGPPAVWRVDLGKGLLEQLTLPVADEADYGPTARPDSDGHFAFFRIVGAGKPHLYVGRLGETNQPLATGRLDGDQPWFVPMASHLIFHSTRDGDHGVFERNVDQAAKARRLSPADERTPFVTPFPSPDGRHIVFASAASGVSQICVMSRDGTNHQQLTFGSEPSCFPAWAPHGDEVLFVRGDPFRSTGQLFLMRLDRTSQGRQQASEDEAGRVLHIQ
jgi:Tol biopolymer transport system component